MHTRLGGAGARLASHPVSSEVGELEIEGGGGMNSELLVLMGWPNSSEAKRLFAEDYELIAKRLDVACVTTLSENSREWKNWSERRAIVLLNMIFGLALKSPRVEIRLSHGEYLEILVDLDPSQVLEAASDPLAVAHRLVVTAEACLNALNEQTSYSGVPVGLGRVEGELVSPDPPAFDLGKVQVRSARPMPEAAFWEAIAKIDAQEARLLDMDEDRLGRMQGRARILAARFTPTHQRAVEGVLGQVAEDTWNDVRGWVLLQGRSSFLLALSDPTVLADIVAAAGPEIVSIGEYLMPSG